MPHGGEADKFGGEYESGWTTLCLLKVLRGEAQWIALEPRDGTGIEFRLQTLTKGLESHSAKRQRAEGKWSPADLARADAKTGRSILADLRLHQVKYPGSVSVFVSGTSATLMDEMCGEAQRCTNLSEFETVLPSKSAGFRSAFEKYIVKKACKGVRADAFDLLSRFRVEVESQSILFDRLGREISTTLCKSDGAPCKPDEVIGLFAKYALDNLTKRVALAEVTAFLKEKGLALRGPLSSVIGIVRRETERVIKALKAESINEEWIPRNEVADTLARIDATSSDRLVLMLAKAGAGKSSIMAMVADALLQRSVPALLIRLDDVSNQAPTTLELGQRCGLGASPIDVLNELAGQGTAVLLLDQVDAASHVGGKSPGLARTVHTLCLEAQDRQHVKVVVACRGFDFGSDPILQQLESVLKPVVRMEVSLLDEAVVEREVRVVWQTPLTTEQIDILRVPLNLRVFLDIARSGNADFRVEVDLFERFWDMKQRRVSQATGNESKWIEVMSLLIDRMIGTEMASVPKRFIDDRGHQGAAEIMASEHVLVLENGCYRFAHDGFLEYAIGRIYAATDASLASTLKGRTNA